jgi:hypothetical protein
MGRKKLPGFRDMKMLASRIEKEDYLKFEDQLKKTGKNLQQVLNLFVVNYISGSIQLQGNEFVVGEKKNE